jgi:hypothetical protein
MIVEPTILRSPKYLALKKALGSRGDRALEYLVALWAHCQEDQRGGNWGKMGPEYVELIAGWEGKSGELYTILSTPGIQGKSGWVEDRNGRIVIHDWHEHNKSLLNSWKSGRFGGRPRKNLPETRGLAEGNRTGTGGASEKRREEKSREDVNNSLSHSAVAERPTSNIQAPKNFQGSRSEAHFPEAEWPSSAVWLAYCSHIGLAQWKAEREWANQERLRWKGITDWKKHASYIRTLWQQDGAPANPPSRSAVNGSGNVKKTASPWEKKQKREALERVLAEHPGNPQGKYSGEPTTAERNDYRARVKELVELDREIAKGEVTK